MGHADVLHWTPRDYLADYKTQPLTLEEHGAYSLLLWHMWTGSDSQCEFPLDYKALAAIWHCAPEEATRIIDVLTDGPMAVLKVKTRRSGTYLWSKRLHEQAQQARIARERQAAKGRRSGEVRRQQSAKRGSTTVHARSDAGCTVADKEVPSRAVNAEGSDEACEEATT